MDLSSQARLPMFVLMGVSKPGPGPRSPSTSAESDITWLFLLTTGPALEEPLGRP